MRARCNFCKFINSQSKSPWHITVNKISNPTRAEYTMGTLEFCRIFGTIPPVVSILTSCVKFSACEPRPNFLARCLFDPNDVVKTDISGKLWNLWNLRNNSVVLFFGREIQKNFVKIDNHKIFEKAYANHMLGTTFNIKDCPNTDRITVVNGLLSMPSG